MKVAVACRQNKARSPFAEVVIRNHFPDFLVSSFGAEVSDGEDTSDFAALVAQRWGLSPMKAITTSKEKFLASKFSPELVLAADQKIFESISQLGIPGAHRSLTDDYIHPELRPSDPDGMEESQFERELAKVANTVLRTIYEWKGWKNRNKVISFIPRGTTDIPQTIAHAIFEARALGAVLIDGDCRAPHDFDLENNSLTPIDFDYTKTLSESGPKLRPNEILRHSRELDKPEKYFLSQSWKALVDSYSRTNPVVIITSPRRSKARSLPDSFLASYFSDSISVISS